MDAPIIRARNDADEQRIAFVVRRAFGGEAEVQLIADLRAEGAMVGEFAAERGGAGIVGYVAFSHLDVRTLDKRIEAAALGPLAVLPTHQRKGVGRALVEHGLGSLTEMKIEIAVVLGDPAFYSRFGFSALPARLLQAPYSGDAFQVLELAPGALGKRNWRVGYPAAFAKLT